MYHPIIVTTVLIVVISVFVLYVKHRSSLTFDSLTSSQTKSTWGKLGDWDVGDKVFDEGRLFNLPYYRNVGWSWWFNQHSDKQPQSVLLGDDGTVNAGPPKFVEEREAQFESSTLDNEIPSFVYAPPVAWIEKKE